MVSSIGPVSNLAFSQQVFYLTAGCGAVAIVVSAIARSYFAACLSAALSGIGFFGLHVLKQIQNTPKVTDANATLEGYKNAFKTLSAKIDQNCLLGKQLKTSIQALEVEGVRFAGRDELLNLFQTLLPSVSTLVGLVKEPKPPNNLAPVKPQSKLAVEKRSPEDDTKQLKLEQDWTTVSELHLPRSGEEIVDTAEAGAGDSSSGSQ